MNELLEKGQEFSIIPQDFKKSNKGKVVEVQPKNFSLETYHKPESILPSKIIEFYSQTKNGMLYFTSSIIKVEGNLLVVSIPRKHRFLQRRTFTRISFSQDLELKKGDKVFKAKTIDLSAGGIKINTNDHIDIDSDYEIELNLLDKNIVNCIYEPLKLEKNENGSYTLAGRFKNLSRTDKMKIIQFCIRKNIENENR